MVGELEAPNPVWPDARQARYGEGAPPPVSDPGAQAGTATEVTKESSGNGDAGRASDDHRATANVQAPIIAPPRPASRSEPRPQILDLVAAYGDALSIAEALPPLVPMRTRQRRAGVCRGSCWRPRWLLRFFLVHHMVGVLDQLERCYHRRAAVGFGTTDPRDGADRAVVDHFRRSLPPLHLGRLVTLLLISVLVVGQLSLVPLVRIAGEADLEGVTGSAQAVTDTSDDESAGSGVDGQAGDEASGQGAAGEGESQRKAPTFLVRVLGEETAQRTWERFSESISNVEVDRLSTLIGHALSTATLDIGSSGLLLNTLLQAGPKTFITLVSYLAIILYLVLRLVVPSFRLKRVLFNLYPHVDRYLTRTSASWHVPRSVGTYRLEGAAFHELGLRGPSREKPFDLVVLALPMLSALVLAGAVAFTAGNWVSAAGVARETHLLGVAVAAVAGLVLVIPVLVRLTWLRDVSRQRSSLGADGSPWGERVLTGSPRSTYVVVRRPSRLALLAGVPYVALGATFIVDARTMGADLVGELGYALPAIAFVAGLVVMILSVPWWYRVLKELRDLGVARERSLGRRPALTLLLSMLLAVTIFLPAWIYLTAVTVRRIRRAQRLVGIRPPAVLLWTLPFSIFVPPLLIAQLQSQLNTVWRRAGHPSPDDGDATGVDAAEPSAGTSRKREPDDADATGVAAAEPSSGTSRKREPWIKALVAAAALTVLALAGVESAPNLPGDDAELDAWWVACDGGDGDACLQLATGAPVGSGYQQLGQDNLPDQYGDDVGLDALWDACDAGGGEACLDLYDAAWPGSGYEGFAERNLPDQYGDAVSLDALWDACDAGDGEACLDLYYSAPWGSGYEGFAEQNLPTGWTRLWMELRSSW